MKRLESVKLVQFYLFEQTELRLREITGIFGRNGSGKSAALDAVQIAMFGGNANLSALNAQADERSATTRTIRAYCLGQHGPAPEHRVRDVATTYITLVWRDTVTNEPLSMGVCLSSSADSETHAVLGRYVLRGIELSMGDHVETVDNKERPREWRTFRHQLVERSRVTGEDPCFDDARRYIQAALLALRGSGGTPAYEAFTRAFRFALKMRFDKPVDQIVRHDVLEARPTNVRRFRELTDTFRSLNEMVNHVDKKVRAGEKAMIKYLIVTATLAITLIALLYILGSRHSSAASSCRREIGPDGIERDAWSFSSGHDNTWVGRTMGPVLIAFARIRHERFVRRHIAQQPR